MRKSIAFVAALALLIASFVGCSNSTNGDAVATRFLTEYYTIDHSDTAAGNLAKMYEKGNAEAYVKLMTQKFGGSVTDDAFHILIVSPGWISLYTSAVVQKCTVAPANISLKKTANLQYSYSLTVTVKDSNNTVSREFQQSGKLAVTRSGKISSFAMDNEEALLK